MPLSVLHLTCLWIALEIMVLTVCGQQTNPPITPSLPPLSPTSTDQTNEGNEFYVGFFRNRFGRTSEAEMIPPILWITTKESTSVNFTVSTISGLLASDVARPGEITYVNIPIGFVVFDSTTDMMDSLYKGIHIKAEENRRIVVFGQNEEVASNDVYLALPIISRPAGSSYEYIAASVRGDAGTAQQAKDSVVLIVGTEDDTEIIVEPSVVIRHPFASPLTGGSFIPGVPVQLRTVTIQRFQTFYLQVRGGDISGTRIIANKPISFFSGHECANVPLDNQPCDILIEQAPPLDTWGTEIVTIPLITRSADIIKVFASQDSTIVSVTRTNISNGVVTSDPSFTLNRNQFRELDIGDYALIQSDNPIGVFQFSRSFATDDVLYSDPFMMWVPPCEQYRDCFAVAPAPFDPSIEGTAIGRVAYVNYTNIAVPVEYFNASMITVNNNTIDASEFSAIRKSDNTIWGYGAQLALNEGAQIIRHQDPNAALSITMYGFANQMSWGCTGGTGLALASLSTAEKPPEIVGGQCIPQPEVIPNGDVTVMIGSPAYINDGYDLTLACRVVRGIPITISWYRDGVLDSSRGNSSATITIANVDIDKDNGAVYTCRADNDKGYDEQHTIVNVFTPLCSHEICRTRRNKLCIIPDSTCLCKRQIGYCSAAYYSTDTRPVPATCTQCSNPTDLSCLKNWSSCVKRSDEAAHGRPNRRMRNAANFKIYFHPC